MGSTEKRGIILLSGGLDSSVAMALALKDGMHFCRAITYDYGQRSAQKEILTAKALCKHYGVSHSVVPLPWFRELWSGGALLTDSEAIPHPTLSELSDLSASLQSAKRVWVPNRNGVFIEIAAGIAESRAAEWVVVGFNREEAATFPDNSEKYLEALTEALKFSTSNQVRVAAPTARMNKSDIVQNAKALGFPFHHLWSCYEGFEAMCGKCESCMRLIRALDANGMGGSIAFRNALS